MNEKAQVEQEMLLLADQKEMAKNALQKALSRVTIIQEQMTGIQEQTRVLVAGLVAATTPIDLALAASHSALRQRKTRRATRSHKTRKTLDPEFLLHQW